jgi:hypothetical protein
MREVDSRPGRGCTGGAAPMTISSVSLATSSYLFWRHLNAKAINTIVKALRITNMSINAVRDFTAMGFIIK